MVADPPPVSTRQPILLGPLNEYNDNNHNDDNDNDDAMDEEEDEDELFVDTAAAVPVAVTHQLLNNFITPSPFPHHTSGPTSSRFRNAFTRITLNPTSDSEAWQALMTEVVNCYRSIQSKIHVMDAEIQLQLDWIESCYGTLLKYFPYSVSHVVAMAEILMAQSARVGEQHPYGPPPMANMGLDLQRQANAQAKLEHLLKQTLGIHMDGGKVVLSTPSTDTNASTTIEDLTASFGMCSHSVDLWMIYISTRVRQARRESPGDETMAKDWAIQAYELALEHAGFGPQNHVLWKAYLQYLKQATVGDPQHMVLLRQVYQRLVCHPMTGLDQLWQEYEQFERLQSEALAQALVGDFTPKYQHARTIYLERNRVFNAQDLQVDRLATPPPEQELLAEEYPTLQLWKTRAAYERTNPERLSTADLHLRIRTTYKEMVCVWTRHPEVWHMWSMWEESTHALDRAIQVLQLAQSHILDCTLLAYAQAQLVELFHKDQPKQCLPVMESFLERAPNSLGYALYQQMVRRYKGKEAARAVFSKARRILLTPSSDTDMAANNVSAATATTAAAAANADDGAAAAGEGEDLVDTKKEDLENGNRWMVTNRLDEGIGQARTTKPVTKEDAVDRGGVSSGTIIRPGPITWHLFASHATIEHRLNHAPAIAARIYELGLRKHGSFLTQPAYVLRYAQLLLELQDTVNLRALLTRALAAASDRKSEQVAALWDMALQFEYLVSIGDPTNVAAAVAIERKRRAALMGPEIEDVATGVRLGMGDSVPIGAQKSTIAEQLVRQDGYDLSSSIVNGMSRSVDVLDIMGLWGSGCGKSNHLGHTISAFGDEEEIIPGGKSDAAYQKRQQFAKALASGISLTTDEAGGGDAGSRLLSARERLQGASAPASQNTAVTMVIQNSPEWLRDLLLLLPASRSRSRLPVLGKPPPHLTEMALAALRQNQLPGERPQDDKDQQNKLSGKRKLNSGNDDDSSDEEGGPRGSGGYGTQFRARQRARQMEAQNGIKAEN